MACPRALGPSAPVMPIVGKRAPELPAFFFFYEWFRQTHVLRRETSETTATRNVVARLRNLPSDYSAKCGPAAPPRFATIRVRHNVADSDRLTAC